MNLTWCHVYLFIYLFSVNDDDEGNHMKRVKEHKVSRKPGGKILRLSEMGDIGGSNSEYKEDTRLEDRLALQAEEEKKYETGEGYGTGGGGGGAGWDDGAKGINWATNIRRQDAAEVTHLMQRRTYLFQCHTKIRSNPSALMPHIVVQ